MDSSRRPGSDPVRNCSPRKASETYMKGVLSFTDEELVSSDFIHNVQLGAHVTHAKQH